MTRQPVFIESDQTPPAQTSRRVKSSVTEPLPDDDPGGGDFVSPEHEPSTDDDKPLD